MMPVMMMGMMGMCLSSSVGAALMMGGEEEGSGGSGGGGGGGGSDVEHVYDFIVKEQVAYTSNTNKFGILITNILADGERVTDEQIDVKVTPNDTKCKSKQGLYECEGDNYGMNDPEPAEPADRDLTWSGWNREDTEVGTTVLTITMPKKVQKFEISYMRPRNIPGWTIKENGVEVLTTSKDENVKTPMGKTITYDIP
jgi:hypothetical protein